MNHRRLLSGVHRSLARKQGINAAAWFAGQSFHQSAADMPLTRLTDAQLNDAGAGLLPTRDICPDCHGTGTTRQQVTDTLTVTASCPECGGRGDYEETR